VNAAPGPRWIDVDPARMPRWVDGFAERHGGPPALTVVDGALALVAPDGAVAACHAPPGLDPPSTVADLARDAVGPLGLLLARRAGYAVGVAEGLTLVSSKVDSRYVQSRTAAGGWSQQRFARRRDNQAKAAAGEAADECVRLLVPAAARLTAVVTGGDRPMVDAVLADPRLAALRPLVAERFLAVPNPKRTVLEDAVRLARSVRIKLTDA
jgi:Actinobacteria/chloroflexi VLRF1 release factor